MKWEKKEGGVQLSYLFLNSRREIEGVVFRLAFAVQG